TPRTPNGRERKVGVVVARREAGRRKVSRVVLERAVEERLPLVAERAARWAVVLVAARLGRPVVVTVRPGGRHQRAVEAVVDCECLARGGDEPQIALVVITERKLGV